MAIGRKRQKQRLAASNWQLARKAKGKAKPAIGKHSEWQDQSVFRTDLLHPLGKGLFSSPLMLIFSA
jgi:hypothetical protein